ncbi:MAG TPA: cupin domain-containing protein [Terriglobales bacterium]|nr:cupin domain-containing protein [Terriglobales bacterium]
MKKYLIAITLIASLAVAQEPMKKQDAKKSESKSEMKGKTMDHMSMSGHEFKSASGLQWGPAPPGIPAGAQAAVLSGDPTKGGMFTIRLKAPAGAKIMPHWHPTDENVTIISGSFSVGMGDKMDEAAAHKMSAGDFVSLKAKQRHYAIANTEAVVQIEAKGPFQITYVNPNDDPRNSKK